MVVRQLATNTKKREKNEKKTEKKNGLGFLARPQKNGKKTKKCFFLKKTFLKREKHETAFLSWVKKTGKNETVPRGRKKKTKRKNVFESAPAMLRVGLNPFL